MNKPDDKPSTAIDSLLRDLFDEFTADISNDNSKLWEYLNKALFSLSLAAQRTSRKSKIIDCITVAQSIVKIIPLLDTDIIQVSPNVIEKIEKHIDKLMSELDEIREEYTTCVSCKKKFLNDQIINYRIVEILEKKRIDALEIFRQKGNTEKLADIYHSDVIYHFENQGCVGYTLKQQGSVDMALCSDDCTKKYVSKKKLKAIIQKAPYFHIIHEHSLPVFDKPDFTVGDIYLANPDLCD